MDILRATLLTCCHLQGGGRGEVRGLWVHRLPGPGGGGRRGGRPHQERDRDAQRQDGGRGRQSGLRGHGDREHPVPDHAAGGGGARRGQGCQHRSVIQ